MIEPVRPRPQAAPPTQPAADTGGGLGVCRNIQRHRLTGKVRACLHPAVTLAQGGCVHGHVNTHPVCQCCLDDLGGGLMYCDACHTGPDPHLCLCLGGASEGGAR